MASRAELLQICEELGISIVENSTINDLTLQVRHAIDKVFMGKKYRASTKRRSKTLIKFMTEEYDYIIKDKAGRKYRYHTLLEKDLLNGQTKDTIIKMHDNISNAIVQNERK